jgi:signal transduction histidine kinase
MTTDTTSVNAPHAWSRWLIGWHIAFWVVMGVVLLDLLTDEKLSPTRQRLGVALVVTLSAAYLGFRPRAEKVGWRNVGYLAVVIVCSGLACYVDPMLPLVLFIAYPQMWIFSGETRNGLILSSVLTLSCVVGFLSAGGWTMHSLAEIGPSMTVSLLSSLLLGFWISRIIDQSAERAELIEQLEATRSELGEAHHAQGVTAERERMAREIHDTLAQGFTSIIMLSQAARAQLEAQRTDRAPVAARLDSIEDVARENLGEARALVAAFSPVALHGTTLTDAVRRLAQRFGAETGVAVDVAVGDSSGGLALLTRDREVVLLRAAQEALANVRRHAQARLVTIRLTDDGCQATVQVDDDGVGFAPPGTNGTAGFGLAGMRGRVRDAGGEVDVVSAPGAGTRVTVRVPLAVA